MIIVPVNIDSITGAISEMLADNTDLQNCLVQRYEEIRKEPGNGGWIGIYRSAVEYPPRTLGMGSGYRNQLIRLVIMAMESDPSTGEEAGQRLDDLLQKIVATLLSDPSLKGTVQTLDEFSVRYFDYTRAKDSGIYMQYAQLNFTGVIPVSAM